MAIVPFFFCCAGGGRCCCALGGARGRGRVRARARAGWAIVAVMSDGAADRAAGGRRAAMSFWRTFGFHTVSAIDTILDKDEFTLEELLDEEEILQEVKSQNKRLLDL